MKRFYSPEDDDLFVEDVYPMRLARKLARQKRIGSSMHRYSHSRHGDDFNDHERRTPRAD